jgi:DNA-directed RNA polymerase subunit RPC12/RpoP
MAEVKTKSLDTFRCMMCGHEWQDEYEKGEDKERACPKCRSNSVRHMKKKRG